MEKIIKLIMKRDKSLHIFLDDEEKHTILAEERTITAEQIYNIINFNMETQHKVVAESEDDTDKHVLDFFVELFSTIIEKVNALSTAEKEVVE